VNILFVTPNAPWPPHTGSAQRSALLASALRELGDVTLLCLQAPQSLSGDAKKTLNEQFAHVGISRPTGLDERPPWSRLRQLNRAGTARLANWVDASRSRYARDERLISELEVDRLLLGTDLIVGRYLTSLTRLGLQIRGIPTLLDVDDLDSALFRSESTSPASSRLKQIAAARHLKNVERLESAELDKFDGLWVANPADRQLPALTRAEVLPNIPFLRPGETPNKTLPPDTVTAGCIASFGHPPNVEGVDWFLEHVWSLVTARNKEARFAIFGSQLNQPLADRWSTVDGVDVVGFVENVADAYAAMTVAVCPVQRGAGTNIKVLEAAVHGRQCVLTQSAARGFTEDETVAKTLAICNEPEQMAECLLKHLSDNSYTRVSAQLFQDAVSTRYSTRVFRASVMKQVESVRVPN